MSMKFIPLRAGDRVEFQDKRMTAPEIAEILRAYRRNVRIRTSAGQERVIHRKYILRKLD
jgi:hypothetical protein